MQERHPSATDGPSQWQRLAELTARASRLRGLRSLADDELLEFGRLYRRAASELSHAQAYGLDRSQVEYLNWLVGRAYGLLYVSESSGWAGVGAFLQRELPETLRRHGRLIALSAGIFLAAALVGAVLTLAKPDSLELISPSLASAIADISERHQGGQNWLPADFRPIASSMIMTNNIQVSFIAFSGGILAGLGTILILLFNGFMLGVLGMGVSRTPAAVQFWAFVSPHGVIELPSIVISAAAGLLLGLALVDPGRLSRLDALRVAGRQAAVIMLGVILFLVVAGLVEGLFSPTMIPPVFKFLAAALLAVAFWSYICLAGRRRGRA